jgi:hypothetical protein
MRGGPSCARHAPRQPMHRGLLPAPCCPPRPRGRPPKTERPHRNFPQRGNPINIMSPTSVANPGPARARYGTADRPRRFQASRRGGADDWPGLGVRSTLKVTAK